MLRAAAGLPLILVLSFVLSPGCGNDSKSTGHGDVTPPAAVLDLAPVAVTDSSLILVWTAPGDDDSSGTATRYDIRYSTFPDSMPDWWDSLSGALDSVPIPRAAGGTESLLVGGLEADTTYFFALRSSDEIPNWSDLSNIARVTCDAASPGTDTIPPGRVTDLEILSTAETQVTLTWTSPGDDGMTGTAGLYDLRYSIGVLDEDDWDQAEIASGIPTPQPAGSTETFTISGLVPDTSYSFGVRARDEAGNVSWLSNVVFARASESTPADTIPPSRVPYLYASARGSGRVFLAWVAPGDDGTSGRASRYEIRFSEDAIDDGSWASATRVPCALIPSQAGTMESMTVKHLPGGWLFFALLAFDDASNASPVSDVAHVLTTVSPPDTITPEPPDTIPPARIEDLRVSRVTEVLVELTWTAPGEDGMEGTAVRYDFRRASSRDVLEQWGNAQALPSPPPPQAAGSEQVFPVGGLDRFQTHYFAVRAMDSSGNVSGISNIVGATLPSLLVEWDTLSFGSEDTERTVRLRCVGDGPLHVRIRTDRPWMSADPAELDVVDQEGTDVIVRVDRAGLAPNLYSGSLRILTPENADTIVVRMGCGTGLVAGHVREIVDVELRPGVFALAPRAVPGARVTLGLVEATTDDSGFYSLQGLEAGTLPLHVSAPFYRDFDSLVAINPPQAIDIRFDPIRDDYFALEVGNRFEYDYFDYSSNRFGEWESTSGRQTWVVQSVTVEGTGDTLFTFAVHSEGVRETSYSPETPVQSDGTKILRLSNNRFTGVFPAGNLVRRYYASYSPDTLAALGNYQYPDASWSVRMKRGVGPLSWGESHRGAMTASSHGHALRAWSIGD